MTNIMHATTVLLVRKNNQAIIASDGQVTLGNAIMKNNTKKVRRLYHNQILAGFAGATADAFTLFETFEANLEKYQGNMTRACVELTKTWRTERQHAGLEAMLIVSDLEHTFILSGNGDVVEPEHTVIAIGSGGHFAQSAALALCQNTKLSPKSIVEKSMKIAADTCIYTNHHISIEALEKTNQPSD